MTNYKQICAELIDALIAHGQPDDAAVGYVEGLLARARAALAEPEPDPEEVKKWLLTNCVFSGMPPEPYQAWNEWAEAVVSAKVIQGIYIKALNSPPEGPTDEELFAVAEAYAEDNGLIGLHNAPDFARAVLARWGNHVLRPIPVSERPEPEDCNDKGDVWAWRRFDLENGIDNGDFWCLAFREQLKYEDCGFTHWLPAHALPLPTHE